MEEQQQFLVRLVSGATRCMRFIPANASCEHVKARVSEAEGIPAHAQRLISGTRELQDGDLIPAGVTTLTVLLRLRGGKGGFGSLLRGAASKAGQKKTNNFDACRDMSGRRLRHVNAEKRIKEWHDEAPLRQLETVALDFLKEKSGKRKTESNAAEEIRKYREQAEQNALDVQAAVLDGLKRASKKRKTDKNKSKQLDEGGEIDKHTSEPSSSKAEKNKLDEVDDMNTEPSSSKADKNIPLDDGDDSNKRIHTTSEPSSSGAGKETIVAEELPQVEAFSVPLPVSEQVEPELQGDQPVKVPVVELKLEDVQNAKDLEAFGLDRLKSELQTRGLKCGGSLTERAARLFLLKTTPVEKLDKKHFAVKSK